MWIYLNDRFVKESEATVDDKKRRELTDARNQADGLVYQIEKTLNENRAKVPAGDVSRIEAAIASLKKAAEGEDSEAIRKGMDDLQKASHAMAEALYKQAQTEPQATGEQAPGGGGQPGGGAGATGAGGDVIDAEVVDEDKKA